MAKLLLPKAGTDVTVYVFIPDSSSAVGAGLTGLAYNSAGLVASYVRPLGSRTAITLATQTVTGAHSDGGFVEVDATNCPGLYRLDLPDAVCATGVPSAVVMLKGATNMVPLPLEIQLTSVNLNDAVRGGLTALPNAAADAAGGLPISDAGGLDLDAQRSDVAAILVDTGTTLDGRLPAALVSGRIDASVGAMAANVMTAAAAASDLTTELQSGLATAASLATVAGYLDTEIAAIKAVTDVLPVPLWSGTLDAVTATSVEFPTGYGISTQAQIVVEITSAGAHFGKSRFATYSGTGDVWTVDKAWNADSETTPTGTPSARAFSVPAEPSANLPRVDVREVGGTVQTAGDLAALVTTLDTVADRIEVDTQDLQSRTPAALVGGRMDASVGAMAANVMTAAAAAADLTTELQSGLATAASLATVAGYLDTEIAAILAVAQKVDTAFELDGAVYRLTVNALELAPTGGSAPTAAAIRAEIDTNSTQLAAIRADTEDLQARTPAALVSGRMDASVGAMAANVVTAAAVATDAVAEIQSGLATAAALSSVAGYLDTEIAAILEDTSTTLDDKLDALITAVAAITTDANAEPTAPPAATATIPQKIAWLFALSTNEIRQSTSAQIVRDRANAATIGTAAVSDAASVMTRGAFA